MVTFEEEKKTEFPKDRLGSAIFLTSLRDFKKEDDCKVEMGVERVGKPFVNENDPKGCKIAVSMSILGEMPKCRVFKVNEETNEYMVQVNEMTGDDERVLEFDDVSGETVTFYLNLKKVDKDAALDENTEIKVHKLASAYPLIRAGFVEEGALDASQKPAYIKCSWAELKKALEGMVFQGKYGHHNGKYKYDFLDVILE